MNKTEFLRKPSIELDFLKKEEREDVIKYYDEMIQDAVEGGQTEEAFIESLGSINTIVDTIRKDTGFVKKVRSKLSPEAKEAISITAKVIGYILFVLGAIMVIGMGCSFAASGTMMAFLAITDVISDPAQAAIVLMTRAGQVVLGAGLIIVAISFFILFFKHAKKGLEKLLDKLQEVLNKEDSKHV
jgi:uncharacterized membrane protein